MGQSKLTMLTIITNTDKLIIRRNKVDFKMITFSNNECTMGKLYHEDKLICHTFELPDRKNAQNISCIPAGTYKIKPVISAKFGNTYKVFDVLGRSQILFHKGNTTEDTQGCILPVSSFGVLNGLIAGLGSRKAYTNLMAILGGENHTLTIERC